MCTKNLKKANSDSIGIGQTFISTSFASGGFRISQTGGGREWGRQTQRCGASTYDLANFLPKTA